MAADKQRSFACAWCHRIAAPTCLRCNRTWQQRSFGFHMANSKTLSCLQCCVRWDSRDSDKVRSYSDKVEQYRQEARVHVCSTCYSEGEDFIQSRECSSVVFEVVQCPHPPPSPTLPAATRLPTGEAPRICDQVIADYDGIEGDEEGYLPVCNGEAVEILSRRFPGEEWNNWCSYVYVRSQKPAEGWIPSDVLMNRPFYRPPRPPCAPP